MSDSVMKNYTVKEKEVFNDLAMNNIEPYLITFIDNVMDSYKVDSPVILNTLNLFHLLNF